MRPKKLKFEEEKSTPVAYMLTEQTYEACGRGYSRGGDVAQLVERRTGTPLRQVRFLGAARDISPSQLSEQSLLRVSVHPRVQPLALTSVRKLTIL